MNARFLSRLAVLALTAAPPSASAQVRAADQLRAAAGRDGVSVEIQYGHRPEHPPIEGRDDGREAAASACAKAAFDSDRQECLAVASRADYFDAGAVAVCAGLSFSQNYPKCMSAVADKEYVEAETRVCGSSPFDDNKVSCLATSGRAPRRDGREYLVSRLYRIRDEIRRGDVGRAYRDLSDLIDDLERDGGR